MNINHRAKQYGKIFGDWVIRDMVGQGSGGKTAVFRLTRNKLTYEETSVMKVINIIDETGRYADMSEEYKMAYSQRREDLFNKAEEEVRLMYNLRGNGNIVNYLDCDWADWEDDNGFGRDLLIRMEYLDNLGSKMKKERLSAGEIVKIGRDICNALITCHQNNIIHRDIKPDNIFIGRTGNYMLGDFGISKVVEESQHAVTMTGTRAYAAPEQFGTEYDYRVDVYSLGLTLYELANGNVLPFAKSAYASAEEIQQRINGKPIPLPACVDEKLGRIILTACEHNVDRRYKNAEEFLRALSKYEVNINDVIKENSKSIAAATANTAYATEPVMAANAATYATEPVMAVNAATYATEPVMPTNAATYATEAAMGSNAAAYATEPTMGSNAAYETEAVFGKAEATNVPPMPPVQPIPPVENVAPVSNKETFENDFEDIAEAYMAQGKSEKAKMWYNKAENGETNKKPLNKWYAKK